MSDTLCSVVFALQSGIGRLLSTAWELVPYSFVVDWFAPIGANLAKIENHLLDDINPRMIGHFWTSAQTTTTYSYVVLAPYINAWTTVSPQQSYAGQIIVRGYNRRGGLPSNEADSGVAKGFSWSRAAQAVALTIQKVH
jgi:hypothetical protein